MKSKGHSHNKFVRIITVPIRVLGKARDLYVKSMTNCAAAGGYGAQHDGFSLPRSFSASSRSSLNDSEDFRELVRAASARGLGNSHEMELFLQQQLKQLRAEKLAKSASVGMGRIDEDKACEFDGEDDDVVVEKNNNKKNKTDQFLYPRSKSCAVTKRSVAFDAY